MSKDTQQSEVKTSTKQPPARDNIALAEGERRDTPHDFLFNQLAGAGSIESQANSLSRLHTSQQHAMLQRLGSTHGNHHVQRVVAVMQGGNNQASAPTSLLAPATSPSRASSSPSPLRSASSSLLQTKLAVNAPDDEYEREADQVADQVMRMQAAAPPAPPEDNGDKPTSQPSSFAPISRLQASGDVVGEVSPEVERNIATMQGGGRPLPEEERTFFEDRMGVDLSPVRIHDGSTAIQTSRDINARAFTVGSNIAFNAGEYQPGTDSGRRLLAHELTHVVQQGATDTVQRKPEADEGICPVCGRKGKGTCPGCGQRFVPAQPVQRQVQRQTVKQGNTLTIQRFKLDKIEKPAIQDMTAVLPTAAKELSVLQPGGHEPEHKQPTPAEIDPSSHGVTGHKPEHKQSAPAEVDPSSHGVTGHKPEHERHHPVETHPSLKEKPPVTEGIDRAVETHPPAPKHKDHGTLLREAVPIKASPELSVRKPTLKGGDAVPRATAIPLHALSPSRSLSDLGKTLTHHSLPKLERATLSAESPLSLAKLAPTKSPAPAMGMKTPTKLGKEAPSSSLHMVEKEINLGAAKNHGAKHGSGKDFKSLPLSEILGAAQEVIATSEGIPELPTLPLPNTPEPVVASPLPTMPSVELPEAQPQRPAAAERLKPMHEPTPPVAPVALHTPVHPAPAVAERPALEKPELPELTQVLVEAKASTEAVMASGPEQPAPMEKPTEALLASEPVVESEGPSVSVMPPSLPVPGETEKAQPVEKMGQQELTAHTRDHGAVAEPPVIDPMHPTPALEHTELETHHLHEGVQDTPHLSVTDPLPAPVGAEKTHHTHPMHPTPALEHTELETHHLHEGVQDTPHLSDPLPAPVGAEKTHHTHPMHPTPALEHTGLETHHLHEGVQGEAAPEKQEEGPLVASMGALFRKGSTSIVQTFREHASRGLMIQRSPLSGVIQRFDGLEDLMPDWVQGALDALRGDAAAKKSEIAGEGSRAGGEVDGHSKSKGSELEGDGTTKGAELAEDQSVKGAELDTDGQTKGAELDTDGQTKGQELQTDGQTKGAELDTDGQTKGQELLNDQQGKEAELLNDQQSKGQELLNDQQSKEAELLNDQQSKGQELLNDQQSKEAELLNDQQSKEAELLTDQQSKGEELQADLQSKSEELEAERAAKEEELLTGQQVKSDELEALRASKGSEIQTEAATKQSEVDAAAQTKEDELLQDAATKGEELEDGAKTRAEELDGNWQTAQTEAAALNDSLTQEVETKAAEVESGATEAQAQVEEAWAALQTGAQTVVQGLDAEAEELCASAQGKAETFFANLDPLIGDAQEAWKTIQADVGTAWAGFMEKAQPLLKGIGDGWTAFSSWAQTAVWQPLMTKAGELAVTVGTMIQGAQAWAQEKWAWLTESWANAEEWIQGQADAARTWMSEKADAARTWINDKADTARTWILDRVAAGNEWISGKADAARTWIADQAGAGREWVTGRADAAREWLSGKADAAREWIGGKADAAREWIGGKADAAREWLSGKADAARTWISGKADAAREWIGGKADAAREWIGGKADAAREWIGGKADAAREWIGGKADTAREWIGGKADAAREWIGGKADAAREWIGGKADAAREWIGGKADAANEWISGKADAANEWIGGKADAAREWISGKADAAVAWFEQTGQGLVSGVSDKARDFVSDVTSGGGPILEWFGSVVNGLISGVEGAGNSAVSTVSGALSSGLNWLESKAQSVVNGVESAATGAVTFVGNAATQGVTFVGNAATQGVTFVENTATGAVNLVESSATGAVTFVENGATTAVTGVESVASGAVTFVENGATTAVTGVESVASGAVTFVENGATTAVTVVERGATTAVTGLETVASGAVTGLETVASGAVTGLETVASGAVTGVETLASGAVTGLETVANGAITAVENVSTAAVNGVESAATGAVTFLGEVGTGAVDVVANAATNGVNLLENAGTNAVSNLEAMALTAVNLPGQIWEGIQTGWATLTDGFGQLATWVGDRAGELGTWLNDTVIGPVTEQLSQGWAQVTDWIEQTFPGLIKCWEVFQEYASAALSKLAEFPLVSETVGAIGDIIEGMILGDFVNDPNGWNILGQILIGFTPIGWIGDARDLIAAISKGSWLEISLALVAFIPGLGDAGKHLDKLGEFAPFLKGITGPLADGAKYLDNLTGDAINALKAMPGGGVDFVKGLSTQGMDALKSLSSQGLDALKSLGNSAGEILNSLGDEASVLLAGLSAQALDALSKYGDEALDALKRYGQQGLENLAERFRKWDRADLTNQLNSSLVPPTDAFKGEITDSLSYFAREYGDDAAAKFGDTLRQRYSNLLKDFPDLSSKFDDILGAGGDLSSKKDEIADLANQLKVLEGLENASSLPRWATRTAGRMLDVHGFDELSGMAGRWLGDSFDKFGGAMDDFAGWVGKGPTQMWEDARYGINAYQQGGLLPWHAVRMRDFAAEFGLDVAFRNTKLQTALGNILGVPGKPESWGMFKGLPNSIANIKSNPWGLAYHGTPTARDLFPTLIRSDYDLASIADSTLKIALTDTQAQALVPFMDAALRKLPSGLDKNSFQELMTWAGEFKPGDRIADVLDSAPPALQGFMTDFYKNKTPEQIFHAAQMGYPGDLAKLPTPSELTVFMPDGSSVSMLGKDAYDYITSLKFPDGTNLPWPWKIPGN